MKLKVIIALIFAAVAVIVLLSTNQKIYYEEEIIVPRAQAEIRDELDAYLDRLAVMECRGCSDSYLRVDSNGRKSFSCLQFQESTFSEEARRFRIEGSIDDCGAQKRLAKAMFLDNPKRASLRWYTSIYTRGLGMPPEK